VSLTQKEIHEDVKPFALMFMAMVIYTASRVPISPTDAVRAANVIWLASLEQVKK
jgi:hypothetical protein